MVLIGTLSFLALTHITLEEMTLLLLVFWVPLEDLDTRVGLFLHCHAYSSFGDYHADQTLPILKGN